MLYEVITVSSDKAVIMISPVSAAVPSAVKSMVMVARPPLAMLIPLPPSRVIPLGSEPEGWLMGIAIHRNPVTPEPSLAVAVTDREETKLRAAIKL